MTDTEPLGDWVEVAPWKARTLLILHVSADGDVSYATTVAGKRAILALPGGLLVAVWPGQWSSTARIITSLDALEVAGRLG